MKKLFLLVVLLSLVLPFDTFSQEQKENEAFEPKTQLEAIHAKIGTTIVEGYSVVGKINVNVNYRGFIISVENWEIIDSSTDEKQIGVVVEIGSNEQSNRSFIDYDEIGTLLQGIEYLLQVDRNSTKLNNFQAIHRTKHGLEVKTFSSSRDETSVGSHGYIEAAVQSSNGVLIPLSTSKLSELQSLIAKAKQQLDLIK